MVNLDTRITSAGVSSSLFERIYIHFLDFYHFQRAKGRFKASDSLIHAEARSAFRLAVLFANEVVIPASSFFESGLAKQILKEHEELIQLGMIHISASEPTIDEHIDAKLEMYGRESPTTLYRAYRQKQIISPPPYLRKLGPSTAIIIRHWNNLLNTGRLSNLLDPYEEHRFPSNLEVVWESIPELLGKSAFVVDHVLPLFSLEGIPQVRASMLEGIIEPAYVSGYTRALHANLIGDLIYLQSPFKLLTDELCLSYSKVARALTAIHLHEMIVLAPVSHLVTLKYSEAWKFLIPWTIHPNKLSQQVWDKAEDAAHILKNGQEPTPTDKKIYKMYASSQLRQDQSPTLALITALPIEFAAMRRLLEVPQDLVIRGDPNPYVIGKIPIIREGDQTSAHNVVLTMLLRMGTNSASSTASNLIRSFPTVRILVMVGIACAVPFPEKPEKHVRLGDIVVSDRKGIIAFDNVVLKDGVSELRDLTPPPSATMIEALNHIEAGMLMGARPWEKYLQDLIALMPSAERPKPSTDKLTDLNGIGVPHPRDNLRRRGQPRLFRGVIGSSNALLRDAKARESLRDKYDLRAIEMEGSGIAEAAWQFGLYYLVIRGTCDYGDKSKQDNWQPHAAAVAASFARALLEQTVG